METFIQSAAMPFFSIFAISFVGCMVCSYFLARRYRKKANQEVKQRIERWILENAPAKEPDKFAQELKRLIPDWSLDELCTETDRTIYVVNEQKDAIVYVLERCMHLSSPLFVYRIFSGREDALRLPEGMQLWYGDDTCPCFYYVEKTITHRDGRKEHTVWLTLDEVMQIIRLTAPVPEPKLEPVEPVYRIW